MNVFDLDSGTDLLLVLVGMFGQLRKISFLFSFPTETSVLSLETQKLLPGSRTFPELKRD